MSILANVNVIADALNARNEACCRLLLMLLLLSPGRHPAPPTVGSASSV